MSADEYFFLAGVQWLIKKSTKAERTSTDCMSESLLKIWDLFGKRGCAFIILFISCAAIWGIVPARGFLVRENLIAGVLAMTGLALCVALLKHRNNSEELQKKRKNMANFFDNAPLGLNWVGSDGIIIWANRVELHLLGYAEEEYVGHSITEFHADQKIVRDMLERLKNHEELQEYEARLCCKDGSVKVVVISSSILWENNKFIHTCCFTRDITDRKRAKESLMRTQAELEARVKERTEELSEAYKVLKSEMSERWRAQRDILEISEREQKRIGQDLHDGLAQQLSGISFMSKTLQHKLAEKSSPEESDIVRILDLLKAAIEDTRRVSRGFYPVELERLGLFSALEELAANKEKMYDISCRCLFDDSIEITDDAVAKHVYRMTQEAILNAVKHGNPSQVTLSIKRVDDDVVLSVEDDGIGIDKNKLTAQMGIRIMKYRADMIGASFSIDNHDRGGTRVTFTFRPEGLPIQIGM